MHCCAAIALRNVRPVDAAPEQRPSRVSIVRIATPPPPTPTPPPATPPPNARQTAPRHAATQRSHASVAPPHVADVHAGNGSAEQHAAGTGGSNDAGNVVATAPAATPKPSCSQPNVAAHVIDAVPADTPDDASDVHATVQVEVTLDTAGRVVDAKIYGSANDFRLDHAALIAAKRSTYAAAVIDCVPASGSYLFVVDFAS
jgi:TonB family protein